MQRLPGTIFQQDNARPHTARVSQHCLRTVTTLPWSVRSPVYPIEHIWDHLGRRVGHPNGTKCLKTSYRTCMPQCSIRVDYHKQKTGSQRQACGHHGLLKVRWEGESRKLSSSTEVQLYCQLRGILIKKQLQRMYTFSRTILPVIRLTLSPNGSKSMTETLLCLVDMCNYQYSIHLRICEIRSNGSSDKLYPVPNNTSVTENFRAPLQSWCQSGSGPLRILPYPVMRYVHATANQFESIGYHSFDMVSNSS
ncbi:transposable element Tcb2 transposase [Trichonephila clavipes]|nr:transposable element Tcb2 transposase [Trichonephila clavipes]